MTPTARPRLHLTSIALYPIKSAAGIAADAWEVDHFGLRHDRRWMVVDPHGHGEVMFDQNVVHFGTGRLSVGAPLLV